MKRYIKTLILICGVTLLSACATKQEAAPSPESAAPASDENKAASDEAVERDEAPTPEEAEVPKPEPEPEPAPIPPAASDVEADRGPAQDAPVKREQLNEAASPDAELDSPEAKGSVQEDKPAPKDGRRLSKPRPAKAGPAAKDAPCDPDKNEDCDPSLLRKLPGR